MSLLAPRPQRIDRASVVLPTVTCSSCAAPIPLSSLGEHVCRPFARATGSQASPRPWQIAIPSAGGPSRRKDPSPTPRPAQPGPSQSRKSPANLAMPRRLPPVGLPPLVAPSADGLHPSPTPSPRTPSPTNPFFPHPLQEAPPNSQEVHGVGLGVGTSARKDGPYPNDAPLTAVVSDLAMLDTSSGTNAGMAGVGRRAFAAAAWSVKAGVALAASARPPERPHPQPAGLQQYPQPAPPRQPLTLQRSQPHPQPRSAPARQTVLPPWQQPRPEQTSREPPLLPRVPLSGRQRSETMSNGFQPYHPPRALMPAPHPQRSASAMGQGAPIPVSPPQQRSASAMSQRPAAPPRKESASSTASDRSNSGGDNISQMLKPRNADTSQSPSKLPFFERYKQMVSSSSGSAAPDGKPIVLDNSMLTSPEAWNDQDDQLVASPVQTCFNIDDQYDEREGSALPWATIPLLAESPVITQDSPPRTEPSRIHARHQTAKSEASSNSSGSSSARSGRLGLGSGPESDEVVTPSQSWNGLAERAPYRTEDVETCLPSDLGMEKRDILEQIGEEEEEDEGERVVFGATTLPTRRGSDDTRMKPSISELSIPNHDSHSRSRTVPEIKRSSESSTRSKTCQKCGDAVGGAKRFVERDGVVLCERDWKELYLPSCRRCNLPIEKSAVSSSDGQLKGKWHRACFTCTWCDEPFEEDSFYVHGGRPWCQQHYHEENGTLCASSSCRQPIEGPCILTAHPNPQRFHPGHLRCDHRGGVSGAQSCREAMDDYFDVAGGRYCERHVAEALRKTAGGRDLRAEKRRTRMVDLPAGGF